MFQNVKLLKIVLCFLLGLGQFAYSAENRMTIASLEIPPYIIAESSGNAKGILVELIKFIAADAQLEVDFEILPWARALLETKQGHYDGIIPTIRIKEREEYLDFSNPLLAFEISLFNVKGKKQFVGQYNDLQDLMIARINNQSGGAAFDNFVKNNKIRTLETNSFKQSIETLIANRTQFALVPKLVGLSISHAEKLKSAIEPSVRPVGTIEMYVAFTKVLNVKSSLYEKFNKSLKKLIVSGKLRKKEIDLTRAYVAL